MLKHLLFPQYCLKCGLESQYFYCNKCLSNSFNMPAKCSKYNCTYLDEIIYFENFVGLNKQIIKLGKYKFNLKVWTILGRKMAKNLKLDTQACLSFVPITWQRFCYRGFNQAKVLAKTISRQQDIPNIKIIKRIKFEQSLTQLNKEERKSKIANVFKLKGRKLDKFPYKTCYLVDDVYTSGATLNSAAKIIKKAYPNLKVIGLCFAKTPKHYV